ncbi:unnamed protein product [Schistosoma bovis]|nr:unnamed protein product [Schistosoma bovis]CAH8482489.1 unnamed protein product [Schistosoma bovis]
MSTGVKCHRSCIEAFECLKRYKKHRYILFHIEDDKEIKVLCQADRTETYHNFKDSLLKKMDEGEGCYAVYDYEAEGKLPTLIFVSWYVCLCHSYICLGFRLHWMLKRE